MFDCQSPPTAEPILQSAAFETALKACGQTPVRLECGTLMLRRRVAGLPLAMLPRVQLLPDTLDNARKVTRSPLIVSPNTPSPLRALPLVSPATQAIVALPPDDAAQRARLNGKWRNRLKQGENAGLRLSRRPLPIHPSQWLLKADAAQQRTRGYRGWPVALTLAYAAAHPRAAMLFEAHQKGQPIAGALILRHGATATYHIAHATAAARACSAQTLLIWTAMRWLARQETRWLDLGLIDTETSPGLARFKLGTGAQSQKLGGTWLHWGPLTTPLRPLARIDRNLMAPEPRHPGDKPLN